jgi:hypothetical protein
MRREQLAEDAIVTAKTEAAEGVVTAAHRLSHTNWGPQVVLHFIKSATHTFVTPKLHGMCSVMKCTATTTP